MVITPEIMVITPEIGKRDRSADLSLWVHCFYASRSAVRLATLEGNVVAREFTFSASSVWDDDRGANGASSTIEHGQS
jgi:hypothetical protein